MPDPTGPNKDLLQELEKSRPKVKAPAMPKAVAERIAKSSLTVDGKQVLGVDNGAPVVADSPSAPAPVAVETETFPDVPEEDRAGFLAHILGAPTFKKSYSLFNGGLEVTFRTRTNAEDDACAKEATKQVPEPAIPEEITPEFRLLAMQRSSERIRLYKDIALFTSLSEMRVQGKLVGTAGLDHSTDLAAQLQTLLSSTPSPTLALLRVHFEKFETLVNVLLTYADKPGFWKAASAQR